MKQNTRHAYVWRLALVSVVLVALTWVGCAHGIAMREGDDYAAEGDWKRAMQSYERALEADPLSKEAADMIVLARNRFTGETLVAAQAAMDQAKWSKAVALLDKVSALQPDNIEVPKLKLQIKQQMCQRADAHLKRGAYTEAYPLALEARQLFSGAPEPAGTLTAIRKTLVDESEVLLADGAFEKARNHLNLIVRYQPETTGTLNPRIVEVEERWADDLRTTAGRDRKANRNGTAFVRYALAYALVKRDDDRQNRDALRDRLVEQGGFSVDLQVKGDRARVSMVRDMIERTLLKNKAVALKSRRGRAQLKAVVDLKPAECKETPTVEFADHRYVSGTRKVSNPEWEKRERTLRNVERELVGLEKDELELSEGIRELERRSQRLNSGSINQQKRNIQKIERVLMDWERSVAEAESALRAAEQARTNAMQRRENTIELQRQVNNLQTELDQRRRDRKRAERSLDDARRTLDSQLRDQRQLEDGIYKLRQQTVTTRKQILDCRQLAREARDHMGRVPTQIDEDVYSTFRYEVTRWTLSCRNEALFEQAKGRDAAKVESLSTGAKTTDTTHPAHTRFGIRENPHSYQVSRSALIQRGDKKLAKYSIDRLEQSANVYQEELLREAASIAASSPDEATRLYITAYLLDPNVGRQAVHNHLQRYGVQDLAILTH